MDNIELFIDETDEENGVESISLVESPALESDMVFLKKQKIELQTVDDDKRIIIGLVLIPDKKIPRIDNGKEYTIFFSKETVAKAASLWMKRLKVNNASLEHEKKVDSISWFQSWMVDDPKMDKINLYNITGANEGTWAVMGKVNDNIIWADIKLGKYKGLSIEAFFKEKQELSVDDLLLKEIKEIIGV